MNFEITEKHIQLLADTKINWYLHKKLSSMKVKFTFKSFYKLITKPSRVVNFLYSDLVGLLAVEYLINGFQNIDPTLFKIYNKKHKKIFDITLPPLKSNFKLRFLNNRFLSLTYNDRERNPFEDIITKTMVFGKLGYSRTFIASINKSIKTKVLKYYNFYIGYDITDTNRNSIDYIEFYDSDFNCIRVSDFLIDFYISTEDELKNGLVLISTDENKTVIKFKNNKELVDITFHKKYTKVCGNFTSYFVKGYDSNYRIEFFQQYDGSYIMYHAPHNHYDKF